MSEALTLLLDTNVWLDYYLAHRTQHDAACTLVQRAVESGAVLLCAAGSLKDVYYVIASEFKRIVRQEDGGLSESAALVAEETAWACACNLQELATPVALDVSDLWVAGKQRALHRDFEDNVVVAAVLRSKARYLVTNDEKLLRHCAVAALDVRDMTVLLDQMVNSA